jgi:hypothetical protein
MNELRINPSIYLQAGGLFCLFWRPAGNRRPKPDRKATAETRRQLQLQLQLKFQLTGTVRVYWCRPSSSMMEAIIIF